MCQRPGQGALNTGAGFRQMFPRVIREGLMPFLESIYLVEPRRELIEVFPLGGKDSKRRLTMTNSHKDEENLEE